MGRDEEGEGKALGDRKEGVCEVWKRSENTRTQKQEAFTSLPPPLKCTLIYKPSRRYQRTKIKFSSADVLILPEKAEERVAGRHKRRVSGTRRQG